MQQLVQIQNEFAVVGASHGYVLGGSEARSAREQMHTAE